MPAVQRGPNGVLERLPLTRTIDEARDAAELGGHRAARAIAVADPVRLDAIVTELADSDDYTRTELAALIGHYFDEPDRLRLDAAPPKELAELLGAAGLTPATSVAVLRAEHVDADTMAGLLPTIGVPTPDAIRVLRDRWDLPGIDAATALGATAQEMRRRRLHRWRDHGRPAPRHPRALPEDPHLWELAAGTMAAAGHRPHVIAAHLDAHAPTLDAFAAGLAVGVDDHDTGLTTAARSGATGDQLAAASEAYGLSPTEAAQCLVAGGATPGVVLDTLDARCDPDTDTVATIAAGIGVAAEAIDAWRRPAPVAGVASLGDRDDAAALLAVLPPPGPSVEIDPVHLLDALPGSEPTLLEPSRP